MDFLFQPETYISLFTLTLLEIVLGIDNIIFISIVTNKLPKEDRKRTRTMGLMFALLFRIILLAFIVHIIRLTNPLFSIGTFHFSMRDLILLLGGVFLIAKSVTEIHDKIEGGEHQPKNGKVTSLFYVILQIVALDIIFSFDSILTAIGLSNLLGIMIAAGLSAILLIDIQPYRF